MSNTEEDRKQDAQVDDDDDQPDDWYADLPLVMQCWRTLTLSGISGSSALAAQVRRSFRVRVKSV